MSCTNPTPALLIPKEDGKNRVKFLGRPYLGVKKYELEEKYGDQLIWIPCGHCLSCIEKRVKDWAVRCSLEASLYESNCFVTLTYNNDWVPAHGVSKKHLQKFIKDLRNEFGSGIRYFAVSEYGTENFRPHYHLIIFNFFPDDAVEVSPSKYGGMNYFSRKLMALWKKGFVSIGDVSFNSCAYVARYCQKKIAAVGQDLGLVQNKEFTLMSRRPGIGYKYFEEHYDSLVDTDLIYAHIGDKYKVSSNRYFDKLIERVDPSKLLELKSQRISKSNAAIASELLSRCLSSEHELWTYQANEKEEKYNRLRRRL